MRITVVSHDQMDEGILLFGYFFIFYKRANNFCYQMQIPEDCQFRIEFSYNNAWC